MGRISAKRGKERVCVALTHSLPHPTSPFKKKGCLWLWLCANICAYYAGWQDVRTSGL